MPPKEDIQNIEASEESKTVEQKKVDQTSVEEKPPGELLHTKEIRHSPKSTQKETEKLDQQIEKISLNLKKENSKKNQSVTKKKDDSPHKKLTIETGEEENKQTILSDRKETNYTGLNENGLPNIEIIPIANEDQQDKGIGEIRDVDLNYLNRGIERVKRARRKSRSISQEVAKVITFIFYLDNSSQFYAWMPLDFFTIFMNFFFHAQEKSLQNKK